MADRSINTVCICGAGTMGNGIVQVAALAGFNTILYDVHAEVLQSASQKLSQNLQKLVDKQKITAAEKQIILQRITFTTNVQQCIADVIIEAIVEQAAAKISLLQQLARINNPQTILASNTSSLSITEIAQQLPHPERVIGMHFFNPPYLMQLVEVVKSGFTSEATIDLIISLAERLGKTPVLCIDSPGFIVNRVARPFYLEALYLAEKNVAEFSVIDQLLEAQGFKMGPFTLMDLIGNDINYAVSCSLYEQLHKPERLKPSALQRERVAQNLLGRKTRRGYYKYD